MRLMIALAVLGFAATSSFAADTAQQAGMKTCAASWKAMPEADKKKTKYTDYMGTCMKAPPAKAAAAPAPAMTMAAKPAATTAAKMDAGGKAKCKDGTVVTYKSRSGTCSGHKGVDTWL